MARRVSAHSRFGRAAALLAALLALVSAGRLLARQAGPGLDPRVMTALRAGESALRARQFKAALDAFKKANDLQHKTLALAWFGMGRAYHGLGQYKNEVEACDQALKYDGGDPRLAAVIHNQRGMGLVAMAGKNTDKEVHEAEVEFRQALDPPGIVPIAAYNLGVVLLREGQDQAGTAALRGYVASGVKAPEVDLAERLIENPRRARGTLAPAFRFTALGGETVSLQSLEGKTVLLDFWGTWCGPCREATPTLVEIAHRYAKQPFAMVGISSDPPSDRQKWQDYIAQNKMEWSQYLDEDRSVLRTFAIEAFPTYIVMDADGVVRDRFVGFGLPNFSMLEDSIKESLKAAAAGG